MARMQSPWWGRAIKISSNKLDRVPNMEGSCIVLLYSSSSLCFTSGILLGLLADVLWEASKSAGQRGWHGAHPYQIWVYNNAAHRESLSAAMEGQSLPLQWLFWPEGGHVWQRFGPNTIFNLAWCCSGGPPSQKPRLLAMEASSPQVAMSLTMTSVCRAMRRTWLCFIIYVWIPHSTCSRSWLSRLYCGSYSYPHCTTTFIFIQGRGPSGLFYVKNRKFWDYGTYVLPPFTNIRCFSFVKQMYLDKF
jgi:hypothetical protein